MSAIITANKLKFSIFGTGHDYTLNDSGKGNTTNIFSHPFVPLGSMIWSGQFYFQVPIYDESDMTAEPVMTDAVRFDISHCSFYPSLGSTFDTEGEATVKAYYHREYELDEKTIIVERTYEQTITVVDHGEMVGHGTYIDHYADGYCFIHNASYSIDYDPVNIPSEEEAYNSYVNYSLSTGNSDYKLSSFPWRTAGIYSGDGGILGITDISELAYADASNIESLGYAFTYCSASDFSPLANWDLKNCTNFQYAFSGCDQLENLAFLGNWKLQGSVAAMFSFCNGIKTLDGLENLDVSDVTDMTGMFTNCNNLRNISAVRKWNVSNVKTMHSLFYNCSLSDLQDYGDFSEWDVSGVTGMDYMFAFTSKNVKTFKGLENWDVSKVKSMRNMFASSTPSIFDWGVGSKLVDISAISGWDVSSVEDFSYMLTGKIWLTDFSAVEGWDTSSAKYLNNMFYGCKSLPIPPDLSGWDFSHVTNMRLMFGSPGGMYNVNYPPIVGKMYRVYHDIHYMENLYVNYDRTSVKDIPDAYATPCDHSATGAENWDVPLSNAGAFGSDWNDRPSWD